MARMTKEEKSWILYDWANSVYVAVMITAIFPIYFTFQVGRDGDLWWSLGTFAATLIMALFGPLLGALADYKGMKKKLFATFLALGLSFTLYSGFAGSWPLMLVGYIFSHVGFTGANLFYDSFLTDVTGLDRMDKISSWGYGMGYIGGSTIPMALGIGVIVAAAGRNFEFRMLVLPMILICILWWGLFSIPFLLNIRQKHYTERPPERIIGEALKGIWSTVREIVSDKRVLFFLLGYFFYIDGVNTVIVMASAYGTSIGLDPTGMLLALLITQVVAFPFAILFGKLAGRYGSLRMIAAALLMYIVICVGASLMGFGLEEGFLSQAQALGVFWVLAVSVGTCQGGVQALSRSWYGKMIPPEKSSRYFSFYDIFGKFASVLGPGLYGLIRNFTGRSSLSILSVVILFVAGLAFLLRQKKLGA